MQQKIKISNRQTILLIIFASIATTVNYIPRSLLIFLTQDAWISIILGAILVIMFSHYPIADLGMRFPNQNLVQISEKVLGKVLGKLLGLIIVYSLFIYHCWSLREFGEFMTVVIPGIPVWIFIIVLSFLTSYAVKSGLEVISRCGEWLFPIGLLSLMVIIVFNFPNVELTNLLPVMESKIPPMFGASLVNMEWLATSSLSFGIIMSYVNKPKDLKKIAIIGIGLGSFILISFSIINITIFGSSFINLLNYQLLSLAKYAKISTEFQRFESFLIIIWVSWMFMRAAFIAYSAVQSLVDLLHINDYRFIVFPETMLATAYSIYMYDSVQEMSYLFTLYLYFLSFTAGIPILLWIIGVLRLKFGKLKPVKQ